MMAGETHVVNGWGTGNPGGVQMGMVLMELGSLGPSYITILRG